jgi:omega-hydroxypalmitate O-feruloyl transferase
MTGSEAKEVVALEMTEEHHHHEDDDSHAGSPIKLAMEVKEPTLVFPSEPTKRHVYFLSNLDQNIAVPMRTVYFFNGQEDKKHDDPVSVIRESLAKLLVHFYPLAGRLILSADYKLQVDCQEQGALFVEAVADHFIAELGELSRPAPFMRQLVYDVPDAKNILEVPPLIVQVK